MALKPSKVLSISTPIIFTEGYKELVQPAGILKTIKDVQAFKKGEKGSKVIPEILNYGDSIREIQVNEVSMHFLILN